MEAAENFNFQDEYEGDQEAIDIKKSGKKKTKAKPKEQSEEIEAQIDDTTLDESEDIVREQAGAESENGAQPDVEEKEIQAEETDAKEEEVATQDDPVLKELNDFYEFINNEDDYYELLRVEKTATSEDIKDSYYQLIKKFHPDANTNFPEDTRIKAEQIFTKVTKAYEILLDSRGMQRRC